MEETMQTALGVPPSGGVDAFRQRSFLSTGHFKRSDLSYLLDLAVQHKHGRIDPGQPLKGKSVALVFLNPSLRTRTSMTIAVQQLGGVPVPLNVGQEAWALEFEEGAVMDGASVEHVKEAAPVLSSYVDAIGVRCFPLMRDYEQDKAERVLKAFERYATVPIINLESSLHHPMQGLGDVLTIRERFGTVDQRKVVLAWTHHPKALPMAVPNSFALAAVQYGMDLTIACPQGYDLDGEVMAELEAHAQGSGGSLRVSRDLEEGCKGAEVVYAKSWGSLGCYGRPQHEAQLRRGLRHWMVTERLMSRTREGVFMHCLPVRRNVVVSDEVLDGPRSIVVEQAANRLHIQKTLLSLIL